MSVPRLLFATAAALAVSAAAAQIVTVPPPAGVPIPLQVQRLAPQLVPFAGSQSNFESLVNGFALGGPVTLTTVDPNGLAQTVSFVLPGGAISSPASIAQALESVRQQLISTGVATPSAQQLGFALTGTAVPVTFTSTGVPGAAAAGATADALPSAAATVPRPSPAEQLQSQSRPDVPRSNTSDSRTLGNTSDAPLPPAPALAVPPTNPPTLRPAPPPRPNARVR